MSPDVKLTRRTLRGELAYLLGSTDDAATRLARVEVMVQTRIDEALAAERERAARLGNDWAILAKLVREAVDRFESLMARGDISADHYEPWQKAAPDADRDVRSTRSFCERARAALAGTEAGPPTDAKIRDAIVWRLRGLAASASDPKQRGDWTISAASALSFAADQIASEAGPPDLSRLERENRALRAALEEMGYTGSLPEGPPAPDLRVALDRVRLTWREALADWNDGPPSTKETADWANRWAPAIALAFRDSEAIARGAPPDTTGRTEP